MYELLNLGGKDLVEYFYHLLPKYSLLVLQMGGHVVNTVFVDVGIPSALEIHVGPTITHLACIYFQQYFMSLEFLWVEDVENGARIMDGRKVHFVCFVVHSFITLEHIVDCLGKWNVMVLAQIVKHLLSSFVLVCHL